MKLNRLVIAACVISVFIAGIYAGVQMQSKSSKQFKFDLSEGQRIVVIEKDADTYIRIKPPEAKVFDYKVSSGKSMKGILVEE